MSASSTHTSAPHYAHGHSSQHLTCPAALRRVGRTGRLAAHGHSFSFFTRNLARVSPPLMALLQAHGQAADPNLVALAEAWALAERHLKETGQSLPGMDAGGALAAGLCDCVMDAGGALVAGLCDCVMGLCAIRQHAVRSAQHASGITQYAVPGVRSTQRQRQQARGGLARGEQ